jgi:hypothetical protein
VGLLSKLFGRSPEDKFAQLIMSRMKRAAYPASSATMPSSFVSSTRTTTGYTLATHLLSMGERIRLSRKCCWLDTCRHGIP